VGLAPALIERRQVTPGYPIFFFFSKMKVKGHEEDLKSDIQRRQGHGRQIQIIVFLFTERPSLGNP
jgi:hypothetical protein